MRAPSPKDEEMTLNAYIQMLSAPVFNASFFFATIFVASLPFFSLSAFFHFLGRRQGSWLIGLNGLGQDLGLNISTVCG
jgi:hypothetical protein